MFLQTNRYETGWRTAAPWNPARISSHRPGLPSAKRPPIGPGRAFTLVELLVVITIISILAALLMPALARVMETARQTSCMNNLRQCGLYTQVYNDQFSGFFPSGETPPGSGNDGWFTMNRLSMNMPDALEGSYSWGSFSYHTPWPEYNIVVDVMRCPSSTDESTKPIFRNFGWNRYCVSLPMSNMDYYKHPKVSRIHNPGNIFLMIDARNHHTMTYWDYTDNGSGEPAHVAYRHQGRTDMLWADTHVNSTRESTIGHRKWFYE